MRILIISSSYPRHPEESVNAGVLARDLALTYVEQGHTVDVITPAKPGGIVFDQGINGRSIPWLRPTLTISNIGEGGAIDALRALTLLFTGIVMTLGHCAVRRPDATVALWALPSGVFARVIAAVYRVPFSVWMLGSDVWRAPEIRGGIPILKWVVAGASGVFADGLELANRAARLTEREVTFLPSVRHLPSPSTDRSFVTQVSFIGRFHPNKGPDLLIGAAALIRRPDVTVDLFGEGDMSPALHRQIEELSLTEKVRIHPPVSAAEASAILRGTRVLAIPSRIESIPLILSDAIQAGTTVVATDVGDMGRIVDRFGLGVLAKPESGSLADAIESALSGRIPPRRQLEAAEAFSLGSAAGRLVDFTLLGAEKP